MNIFEREITPVKEEDFFIVLNNFNATFDFPIHYHPEFELNFVMNSKGKRFIGDSIEEYEGMDLVLVGPNTPHAWMGNDGYDNARVITVQFQQNFFSDSTLRRKLMSPIAEMVEKSYRGILFSPETQNSIKDRIIRLCDTSGFDSFLDFISILYDLSISRNQKLLSSASFVNKYEVSKSKRIKLVSDYIQENYKRPIKLKEVAEIASMPETSFSHYFKKHTHRSFTEYIHDIRVGNASRLLVESEDSIAQIGYECGFNNLSNFNRIFKKKRGCTPTEFRESQISTTKYKV